MLQNVSSGGAPQGPSHVLTHADRAATKFVAASAHLPTKGGDTLKGTTTVEFTITIPNAVSLSDDNITSDASLSAKAAELITKAATDLNAVFNLSAASDASRRSYAETIVDLRCELAGTTTDRDKLAELVKSDRYRTIARSIYAKAGIAEDKVSGSIQSGIRYHVGQVLIARGLKDAPTVKSEADKVAEKTARDEKVLKAQTPASLATHLAEKVAESPAEGVRFVSDAFARIAFAKVTEADRDAVHAELVELAEQVNRMVRRFAPAPVEVAA